MTLTRWGASMVRHHMCSSYLTFVELVCHMFKGQIRDSKYLYLQSMGSWPDWAPRVIPDQ